MEPEGSLPRSQKPTTVPILIQMRPVHTFPPYFPKIHSNTIFPCTPRSSEWSLSLQVFGPSLPCVLHVPPISLSFVLSS